MGSSKRSIGDTKMTERELTEAEKQNIRDCLREGEDAISIYNRVVREHANAVLIYLQTLGELSGEQVIH